MIHHSDFTTLTTGSTAVSNPDIFEDLEQKETIIAGVSRKELITTFIMLAEVRNCIMRRLYEQLLGNYNFK